MMTRIIFCVLWLLCFSTIIDGVGLTMSSMDKQVPIVEISQITSGKISNGTVVRIEGRFLGWSGCSEMRPYMLTRSDWAVEDATGCIMVSGPLPDGLKPHLKETPKLVVVKGIVRIIPREKGRSGVVIQAINSYLK